AQCRKIYLSGDGEQNAGAVPFSPIETKSRECDFPSPSERQTAWTIHTATLYALRISTSTLKPESTPTTTVIQRLSHAIWCAFGKEPMDASSTAQPMAPGILTGFVASFL